MAWDDAKKAKAVKLYLDAEPTADTSIEIVKDIAEQLEETVNGVRMILTKAEVYVKKAAATTGKPAAAGGKDKPATTRVSKADAQEKLEKAIEAAGCAVDQDITGKITGKAAVYFAEIISKLGN